MMKIIKNFSKKDDKTGLVSEIFENIVKKIKIPFDSLTFYLENENGYEIKNNNAYIHLNYNNYFIQSKDIRAIKIIILHHILHAIMRKSIEAPHFIEDIVVNRKLVEKGFDDDLFYVFYLLMIKKKKQIDTLKEFLEINTPWLSFQSGYNSDIMKKMITKFKYKKMFEKQTKKLFLTLKKDVMDEKNMQRTINAYNDIMG